MTPYRIILTDDHLMLRQGLRRILAERKELEVIGEAGSGLELLKLLKSVTPDMVILDISMPGLRGLEAIREIETIHPEVKVLILTMHKDKEYLHQAIAAGAHGYLLKEDADSELFSAVKTIRQGRLYLSPFFTKDLTEDWAQALQGKRAQPFEGPLSMREREVLKMIAEGKTSKEIADLLFVSPRTVDRHRANIMDKLQKHKTADLVKYALEKRYV
jgi:DNA-binding NarL/FixJ family response regulator